MRTGQAKLFDRNEPEKARGFTPIDPVALRARPEPLAVRLIDWLVFVPVDWEPDDVESKGLTPEQLARRDEIKFGWTRKERIERGERLFPALPATPHKTGSTERWFKYELTGSF